jgi:phage tail-like protein
MDVNGTKFHLLYNRADWGLCFPEGSEATLAELWDQPDESKQPALEWNGDHLRLRRLAPLFRQSTRSDQPLDIGVRRGSARDQYGHFYWINAEQTGIRFLANGARTSVLFWSSSEAATVCEVTDEFSTCAPPTPYPLRLCGLAVTTRHYLVVGNVTQQGILIFDLHRGGPPLWMQWGRKGAPQTPFQPLDIAATPDGGVLILDAANLRYWKLDEHFRLVALQEEGEPALFQPSDETAPKHVPPPTITPLGFSLAAALPGVALTPVSIEPGPEGHVLILDLGPDPTKPSLIHEIDGETLVHTYSLQDAIQVADPEQGEGEVINFSILAHDMVYVECCAKPLEGCDPCLDLSFPQEQDADENHKIRLLYVAERDGNQVVAFVMDREPLDLIALPDFLPLRRFVGKALIGYGGKVYYDFQDRFVPLQVLVQCHFAGRAVITTPVAYLLETAGQPPQPIAGRPFDSNLPGCVWHRLLLDADIPVDASVRLRARAADDPELLVVSAWIEQPVPYRRSNGAELPFYTPPAFQNLSAADPSRASAAATAGTWEFLFQGVSGRFLQLEVTMEGTGRNTPELYALRAWYPRFSYLDHYLPAIYREEPVPASFLERWLANFEGFYTHLEDQIEQLPRLLDPRTTPAEALDWLACWFGLVLDPLWQEERRRFFIQHAFRLYGMRGTVPGLEIALRLYIDAEFGEWFFDPNCWGRSKVRIIEHFLTAGGDGLVFGDTSASESSAFAHRFTVLIPHDVKPEDEEMLERLIHLEKPAHTAFELKRYWDLFRVGEARLGIDTQLGDSAYLTALMLGVDTLGVHYLAAAYPYDLEDRMVLERDRLGDFPL